MTLAIFFKAAENGLYLCSVETWKTCGVLKAQKKVTGRRSGWMAGHATLAVETKGLCMSPFGALTLTCRIRGIHG